MHSAMRNGRLNSVEDLQALDKGHGGLPTAWNDMSHDIEGVKQFHLSGGSIFLAYMVLSTVAAIIAICIGGDRVWVFWLSIAAIVPLGIQLADISEVLSAWCVLSPSGVSPRV